MSKRSGPPPIVFILIFLALIGGGYWWFFKRDTTPQISNQPIETIDKSFPAPTTVPSGTAIKIDGSTSMVRLNKNLKRGFENKFPGTNIVTDAKGSSNGIQALINGTVDIAAVSRPLSQSELSQGLIAVPVATDAIAIIVGKANPFIQGLSSDQVADIFQGKINNWSQVGGSNENIRVINRPAVSGTHQTF
ncbi:MAG: extracellular solute-binding protein [Rivularia sp. (in: cyanobacteria)]